MLIIEIKNQEYHVNLHLLLIFLISMVPHLRGQREQSSFLWFSQKLRVKYRTCMVVDKNTDHLRTRTGGLKDLLTIHGLHNKMRTNYSLISWQSTDLQFTDLTKHGPIFTDLTKHGRLFKLRTPPMIYEKKKKKKKKEYYQNRNNVTLWITWRFIVIDAYMYVEVIQLYRFLIPILMM